MADRPPHIIRAVQGDWEWGPVMHVECPHHGQTRVKGDGRDCNMLRCWEGIHDPECDDGSLCQTVDPDTCVVQDWLDAEGPDAVALAVDGEVELPVKAHVEWDHDHPVLRVIGEAVDAR